jgi:hypothetical protein
MSKLARALALVAMLAAMTLAGMTAVAQAHVADQDRSAQDATVQRLLARERFTIPSGPAQAPSPVRPAEHSGQAGWLAPALAVLALVLAVVAGVAVIATRRANRMRRAGQPA